jgi:indolepyruvate ferredoxin oxidoreductase
MTGLAQKGGAVMSHVRLADRQSLLHSARIATGEAKLLLGCDMVVAVSEEALSKAATGYTRAVVNTGRTITGEFIRNPDRPFPEGAMEQSVADAVGTEAASFLDAGRLATKLMGHSIATNIFMLGFAFQRGLVPLSSAAILRAIALNGAAVDDNTRAFNWGRRTALDPQGIEALVADDEPAAAAQRLSANLDEIIARRRTFLVEYQDEAYAQRYADLVAQVRQRELEVGADATALSDAVARNYFKLLAYKDEYEVARLFASPAFGHHLAASFEGDYRLNFHITLPWSRGAKPGDEPKKIRFGPWLLPAMKFMAGFRFLRGTAFNPFGRIPERVQERELIADYEQTVAHILENLTQASLDAAVALASVPDGIRGYGPVKEKSIVLAHTKQAQLLAAFNQGVQTSKQAA